MSDNSRQSPAPQAETAADQGATLESLLVAGLDLYFAGEYERAIHAWTRVLFIDRGHPRARAYIERARQVLAERQRQADLLLHAAIDAFDAGDLPRARALLEEAVAGGTQDSQALALRDRLDRLLVSRLPQAETASPPPATAGAARPAPPRESRRTWWAFAGLCALAIALAVAWPQVVERVTAERTEPIPIAHVPAQAPLPVPRPSDLLLERAEGLFARGHLHEAAALLDGIRLDDPRRGEADRLLADIQRVLLSGAVNRAEARVPADTAGPAR